MAHLVLTCVALVIAATVEAILLARILTHSASGGIVEPHALESLVAWAFAPLVAAGVITVLSFRRRKCVPFRAVLFICFVGPILGFIALRQYSHASPGFLLVAFVAQWVAVAVAARSSLRNAT